MEYLDLKGFERFVADRDLVPEANRSFYIHWIRRFLSAEFGSSELEGKDKVECFADQLSRDSSVLDWQHRQALQAVSLYLDVYLRQEDLGARHAGAGIPTMDHGQDARLTSCLAWSTRSPNWTF